MRPLVQQLMFRLVRLDRSSLEVPRDLDVETLWDAELLFVGFMNAAACMTNDSQQDVVGSLDPRMVIQRV